MPKSVPNGIPFLSAKDLLDDGTINFTHNIKLISEEDYIRLSKKSSPQMGDIIYSRIGACLGKARIVDRNVKFLVSYSCCVKRKLRPLFDLNIDFYYYVLYVYKGAGLIGGKGIGIQGLSSKALDKILLPFPPMNEQSRIIQSIKLFLDTIKDGI